MIEFFFDCSSPWTYLAFHNIQPLAKEFGTEIVWRPILVGGIFNTINPSVYAKRENPVPAKLAYEKKDIADWARVAGLTIKMRPTVFPVNSVKAMRGCLWLGKDMLPFARTVFQQIIGIKEVRVQDAEPLRIGSQPGFETLAKAKDSQSNADVMVVQWLRFGTAGFLQMVGIVHADAWSTEFTRLRTIRDSIDPR